MITGTYSARFMLNNNLMGTGRVVIDLSVLHGEDSDYMYTGKYQLADNNRVSATVEVTNYSEWHNSVLGPLSSYRLTLTGVGAPGGFILSGQVDGKPHLMISIELTKISESVDQ